MPKRSILVTLSCVLLIAGGFWIFCEFGQWFGFPPGFKLNARATRARNYHEMFYTQIAGYFGDAKMCAKIGDHALDEISPTLEIKWRVSFQRSECYLDAALQTKDATLCRTVRKVITVPSNASDISEANCRSLLLNAGNATFGLTPSFSPSADIMHEMGYRDEDYDELAREKLIVSAPKGGVDWGTFYSYLLFSAPPQRKADFLRRAESLPNFK